MHKLQKYYLFTYIIKYIVKTINSIQFNNGNSIMCQCLNFKERIYTRNTDTRLITFYRFDSYFNKKYYITIYI